MVVGRRLLAAASAAALAAVFGSGVQAAQPGISFTSQAGTISFTHYVVTPQGRAGLAGPSNAEGNVSTLSPKGDRHRNSRTVSGGVDSNNTVSTGQASASTPATSASFIGQQSSATTCSYFGKGCNPPDMALAASSQFVLQGVNTQWQVWDTAGNVQAGWPVSAQNFFGVPNQTNPDGTPCDTSHGSQPFLSDPRALYDTADGRFWAAMLQVENAFGVGQGCPFQSTYYVAVSQTSDPRGKWNVYAFDMTMGQPFAADYTQLGVNSQAVYLSANMFGNNGGFYAELFEANKAQMEKGKDHFTAAAFFNLQGTGPGTTSKTGPFLADTVQPALNLDNSAGTAETFVDTVDGPDLLNGNLCGFTGKNDPCSGLVVWRMSNPIAHDSGGPAPALTGAYVPTQPFLVSPPSTQPSCSQCIDGNDLRIPATPVIRNGKLYAAWDVAVHTPPTIVPGAEWAIVDLSSVGTGAAPENGYYNFSGDDGVTYPALMPDSHGNVLMVFDHMSSTVFPEIRYVVKGAGEANFTGAGVLLKAGESSYRPTLCGGAIPVCRWGDYEATSFDGSGHIWFASQYANQFQGVDTPPAFGRNWGTWIGAISAS
jgi:hypothetical protein